MENILYSGLSVFTLHIYTSTLSSTKMKRMKPQHTYHATLYTQTHTLCLCVFAIHHSAPPLLSPPCLSPPLHSAHSRCARTEGAQSHSVSQSLSPRSESETPPVCLSACVSIARAITPLPHRRPARKPHWWLPKLEDSEVMWEERERVREASLHCKKSFLSIVLTVFFLICQANIVFLFQFWINLVLEFFFFLELSVIYHLGSDFLLLLLEVDMIEIFAAYIDLEWTVVRNVHLELNFLIVESKVSRCT